jgi:hypothetical protein
MVQFFSSDKKKKKLHDGTSTYFVFWLRNNDLLGRREIKIASNLKEAYWRLFEYDGIYEAYL